LTYHIFQSPPPSFEPTLNPAEIEEKYVRNPGVDTHVDSGPLVRAVSMFETVTKIPATNEGQGSWKQHRKHPITLYRCNCREIISGSKVEWGEGVKLVIKLDR
jgi:hypothetical protein